MARSSYSYSPLSPSIYSVISVFHSIGHSGLVCLPSGRTGTLIPKGSEPLVILTLQAVVLAVVIMQIEVPGDVLVNLPCLWRIPPWFHYKAGPLACQLSGLIITGQHNRL